MNTSIWKVLSETEPKFCSKLTSFCSQTWLLLLVCLGKCFPFEYLKECCSIARYVLCSRADKGVALVVIDTVDYIKKAKEILEDTNTYRVIQTDPTSRLKNKLISNLRRIKTATGLQENIYRKMYPTGASPPRFYGLPKIHKKNIPLRPIVSSIGSVAYGLAKVLADIIKPLMGCSEHHVQNSQMFVEEIKDMKLEKGECITSYDVVALFTSIPISSALEVMKKKLDTELQKRTILPVDNILELLAFCLNNTYFVFQDTYYEQTKEAAMGSSISPIIANIYMEAFEQKAIATALHPLEYGEGMLMIPGLYNNKNINNSSSSTSTQ